MRCKDVIRIMPELAAGEIDNIAAAEAMTHVDSCSTCKAQLEHFKRSMAVLARPKDAVATPSALDQLVLSDRNWHPFPYLRTATATICLVALAAISLAFLHHKPMPDRVAINQPVIPTIIKEQKKPIKSDHSARLAANTNAESSRQVHLKTKFDTNIELNQSKSISRKHNEIGLTAEKPIITAKAPKNHDNLGPEQIESSISISVCEDESYEISLMALTPGTGEFSEYSAVRDSSGECKQVSFKTAQLP